MGSKHEWASRTEPAVGERWVHRRGENDDLAEVEVLRIGVRKPARLLVRFVADEFEGLHDWVPPSRLKALWRDVREYSAWSVRWRELMRDAPDHDSHLLRAAQVAVGEILPESLIEIGWNYTIGVSFIHDVPGLALELGVPGYWALTDKRCFAEGTTFVAPWPTTLAIAQMAASRQPRSILRWIEIDEARARREAIHGRYGRSGGRYDSWAISGEDAAAIDAEHSAPVRDLLRQWIGAEHADQSADLEAAREDARRLSALAAAALESLRGLGHKRQATLLEHKFGNDASSSLERRPPRGRQRAWRASHSGDQADPFRLPITAPESPPVDKDQPVPRPNRRLDISE